MGNYPILKHESMCSMPEQITSVSAQLCQRRKMALKLGNLREFSVGMIY